VIKQQLAIVASLVSQLKKLHPPAADAAQFTTFITETAAQNTDIVAALAAAAEGDKSVYEADLKKVTAAGEASNKAATALGLAACAKNYQPHGS
jgi:hypothetical protein